MKREFIQTADGSTSIYLPEMEEHYHSKHGAIVESKHIFVQNGLMAKRNLGLISVFEVGMGTGLNVLTSIEAANCEGLKVNYQAVEAFPIKEEELKYINFSELLAIDQEVFNQIHRAEPSKKIMLSNSFSLVKFHKKLGQLKLLKESIDVIYFDAFAPEKQAEMWTEEIFANLFVALKDEGILVTYCVKGDVRRRLQKVGFTVEKLKGPKGGKREMCRAWKRNKELA